MKTRQKDSMLRFGLGQTLLGDAVVIVSDKGVRELRLLSGSSLRQVLAEVQDRNPDMELLEDNAATSRVFQQIDKWLAGKIKPRDLSLDLQGSPFQMRVWREMLQVPHGTTCSYTELARRAGKPRAVRAAASACARNPVGLLVPCHRIVRQDGSLGGYYWGLDKKKRLLAHERACKG